MRLVVVPEYLQLLIYLTGHIEIVSVGQEVPCKRDCINEIDSCRARQASNLVVGLDFQSTLGYRLGV